MGSYSCKRAAAWGGGVRGGCWVGGMASSSSGISDWGGVCNSSRSASRGGVVEGFARSGVVKQR